MVKKKTVIIGIGATTVGVAGLALFLSQIRARKFTELFLNIKAGVGGTTNTDFPPGLYAFRGGELVTIVANANSGYYVSEWKLNNEPKGYGDAFSLLMDKSYDVEVNFTTIPPPPPDLIPVQLQNVTAPPELRLDIKQIYLGWWENLGGSPPKQRFHVSSVSGDYTSPPSFINEFTTQIIEWKVLDFFGQPVGNEPALISSTGTDIYGGIPYIGDSHHTLSNPLEVFSNSDGIISVPITYQQLSLRQFSEEHLYNFRNYFLIGQVRTCLYEGRELEHCYAGNACTFEANATATGIHMGGKICNLSEQGVNVIHETVPPMSHTISIKLKNNPAIQSSNLLSCAFGIKNTGIRTDPPPSEPIQCDPPCYLNWDLFRGWHCFCPVF